MASAAPINIATQTGLQVADKLVKSCATVEERRFQCRVSRIKFRGYQPRCCRMCQTIVAMARLIGNGLLRQRPRAAFPERGLEFPASPGFDDEFLSHKIRRPSSVRNSSTC